MSNKVSIAIDAMGGDDSPHKVVEGVKYFLNKNKDKNDFIIKLFGMRVKLRERILKLIKTNSYNPQIQLFQIMKLL